MKPLIILFLFFVAALSPAYSQNQKVDSIHFKVDTILQVKAASDYLKNWLSLRSNGLPKNTNVKIEASDIENVYFFADIKSREKYPSGVNMGQWLVIYKASDGKTDAFLTCTDPTNGGLIKKKSDLLKYMHDHGLGQGD